MIARVLTFCPLQSDHVRFDYLSRETYAEHSDGAKALDLRLLWPVLPNLWLLLVTYQEKRPEFENNRYCYCCIVGIAVLLSKVSDYLNKFRLGLGRCHLEQRACCLNVNWQIQVGTMGHFLIRLIDLQGSVTLNHRRQKHRFSQISRE